MVNFVFWPCFMFRLRLLSVSKYTFTSLLRTILKSNATTVSVAFGLNFQFLASTKFYHLYSMLRKTHAQLSIETMNKNSPFVDKHSKTRNAFIDSEVRQTDWKPVISRIHVLLIKEFYSKLFFLNLSIKKT